ncbi:hypothetical protein MIND_00291300 [Mycena indigotica]|uniref:Uncharacterized protein n=1 Tax=Mycena indigotica TaxID=2126181 RepID=A0A8H6TA55_9AGAR|nr:uncharacterized protein MIND_00291300 [Mycena indigotica]KAF7312762.1 hypothetical protein MIND_00291300 [Mycena indigotica]
MAWACRLDSDDLRLPRPEETPFTRPQNASRAQNTVFAGESDSGVPTLSWIFAYPNIFPAFPAHGDALHLPPSTPLLLFNLKPHVTIRNLSDPRVILWIQSVEWKLTGPNGAMRALCTPIELFRAHPPSSPAISTRKSDTLARYPKMEVTCPPSSSGKDGRYAMPRARATAMPTVSPALIYQCPKTQVFSA